jgi:hypothetical protein
MNGQQVEESERQREQHAVAEGIGQGIAARLEPVTLEALPERLARLLERLSGGHRDREAD